MDAVGRFSFLMERYIDTFFLLASMLFSVNLSIKFDLIYNKKCMLR